MVRDETEQELWLRVWIAVAASANCHRIDSPATWADRALADYRKRFPETPHTAPPPAKPHID